MLLERTNGITVWYSDNDEDDILKTVEILKSKIPQAEFREFKGLGHFCIEDLHTEKFPELLKEVLK